MADKKRILLIIIILAVIALLAWGLYFKFTPRSDMGLKLTEDKLVTNQTLIDMIVNDKISPLGNNLTESVLRDDYKERGIFDGVYKVAYYTCSNNEHEGWIYYNSGKISKLYGPYGWCYV
jgi:hypothetical protein